MLDYANAVCLKSKCTKAFAAMLVGIYSIDPY